MALQASAGRHPAPVLFQDFASKDIQFGTFFTLVTALLMI
jgi:hypothetical protein